MKPTQNFVRHSLPFPILGALLCFIFLWRLDYPKPIMDDLFQAGAAFNIAGGGDLSNPLIARQEFPSHFFFVYPPLNSYALGAWFKVFGISAAAATGYVMFDCFLIAAATILLLRRHGASPWLQWVVPLGVIFGVMPLGLRPEPVSIALAMIGFMLVDADASRKNAYFQFTGFLCIFLGGSGAPRVTLYIAALAVYAGYRAWTAAGSPRERGRVLAWWLGALMVAGLTFLVMIDFRLGEFLRTFRYHASGRLYTDKIAAITSYLFSYLGYLQLPLVILPLLLLVVALRKPGDNLSRPAIFIAGAIPLVLWTGGVGSATAWWAFLMLALLAGSLLKQLPGPRALILQIGIVLIMVTVNRKVAVECWGILTGHIKTDRGSELAAVNQLKPTPEHPLLLDGWVARYVYDYRLPKGVLDVEWSTRFPGGAPGSYRVPNELSPQLHPGDVFVVGSYMLQNLKTYTLLEHPAPPSWHPLDLRGLKFDEYPRWAYIVTAENCKSVREGAATTLPTGL